MIRQPGILTRTRQTVVCIPLQPPRRLQRPCCYQERSARTANSVDPMTDTRDGFAHPNASPTTTAIRFIGSKSSSSSSFSPFPFLHYALSTMSTQLPPLRMFTIPPTRSVAALPLFFFFGWHTETCRVLSCRSCPYVTPHSSTFHTTIFSYLFNPFRYYQALIPPFRSGSPFRCAISPYTTITPVTIAARSLPESQPFPRNTSVTQLSPQ